MSTSSFDSAGGGSRKWWMIGGGCLLLLVCVCAISIGLVLTLPQATVTQIQQLLGLAGGESASIAYVPTSAPMFMVLNPSIAQASSAKKVMDILGTNPALRQQFDNLTKQGAGQNADFSFERDVAPWLGTELSVALLDVPAQGSTGAASVPNVVVLAATRDQTQSDAALKRLRASAESHGTTFTETAYKGATIVAGTRSQGSAGGDLANAYTTYQGMVILGSSADSVKKAIDTQQAGSQASLSSSQSYKAMVDKLPKDRALTLVADLSALAKSAQTGTNSPGSDAINALSGMAISLGFTDNGIRIDSVVNYDLSKMTDASRALLTASHANPNKVLGSIPATSLVVLSGQDLKQIWDYYNAILSQDPQSQKQFQQSLQAIQAQTGLDVGQDIFSWMTGEFAISVVPAKPLAAFGTDAPSAGLLLFFETPDPAVVKAKFDKITQALSKQGLVFASKKISGVDMQVIQGLEAQGLTAGFGFVGNYVVIGSADDVLAAAADGGKSPLNQDAEFKLDAAVMPQPNSGIAYFSIPRVIDVIKASLPSSALKDFQTNVEPALQPFKSIEAGGGVQVNGSQTSVIFIHVAQ